MDVKTFIARVVPDDGKYYIGTLKNKKFNQFPISSLGDIENRAAPFTKKGKDVYFATGTYKDDSSRKAANVKSKKSLYVDIDCGPSKPYATKADGIKALKTFLKQSGIQNVSILVDTGNGYHCYWAFADPIGAEEWKVLAEGLKSRCTEYGFKVDGVVTMDITRILRVPGTTNYKDQSNPKPCKIVYASPDDVDFARMVESLNRSAPAPLTLAVNNEAPAVPSVDAGDLGQIPDYSDRKWYAQSIIDDCPTISYLHEIQGAGVNEPMWRASLQLLAFTADGEDFVHEISKGHAGYAPMDTDMKYQQAKDSAPGPTTCKHFQRLTPHKCNACPHLDKIKSPIVLGKPPATYLPYPYQMNSEGITRFDAQAEEHILVTRYQVYSFALGYNEIRQLVLSFTCHAGKSPPKQIEFSLSELLDMRIMSQALAEQNMVLHDQEKKEVRQLMITWAQRVLEAKQTSSTPAVLGWTKDRGKLGFVLANQVVWDDGNGTDSVTGSNPIIAQYIPQGTLDHWSKAAAAITNSGNIEMQVMLASAFAAPLIKFTGTSGTMLSIVSAQSGVGKTSAMRVAQAVWGNPKRGINSLNDTPLSVSKRLGKLNNLPAYWDELHMRDDVDSFLRLMFQLAQGKEKSRLKADTSMQEVGTWETIITVASNESVMDHILTKFKGTNAGAMRILELDITHAVKSHLPLAAAMKLFGDLDHNYGHAGLTYAFYITEHNKAIGKQISNTIEHLSKLPHMDQSERMRISLVSALLVGAHCANSAGLTNFDIKRLSMCLVGAIKPKINTKGQVVTPLDTPLEMLKAYIHEHAEHQSVIERMPARGGAGGTVSTIVIAEPRRLPVIVQTSSADSKVRVEVAHLRDWITKHYGAGTRHLRALKHTPNVLSMRSALTLGLKTHIDGTRKEVLQVPAGLLK